jgi:ribosomal protein L12E/L44/L45/RPP1/RPP2
MAVMKHPNLDSIIEVPETAVPIHMRSGWQLVEGKKADEAVTEGQVHDPSLAAAVAAEEPAAEDTNETGSASARRTKKGE